MWTAREVKQDRVANGVVEGSLALLPCLDWAISTIGLGLGAIGLPAWRLSSHASPSICFPVGVFSRVGSACFSLPRRRSR